MNRVDMFPTPNGEISYVDLDMLAIVDFIQCFHTDGVYIFEKEMGGSTYVVYQHYVRTLSVDTDGQLCLDEFAISSLSV